MSITYEEALSTLQAMFGEPWTRDSLDAVLRHEKGHMENTCERILNHGDGDPQILVERLKSGKPESQLLSDAHLARQISQQDNMSSGGATTRKKRRGAPAVLPDDFLRVPGYKYQSSATPSTGGEDEALARMLQDELYSQELARNPNFAHLAVGRRTGSVNRQNGVAQPSQTANEAPRFMEKVSELGDNARKRLAVFAARFEERLGGRNNHPSSAGALVPNSGAAAERRGLLDDDYEDTIEFETRKNQ